MAGRHNKPSQIPASAAGGDSIRYKYNHLISGGYGEPMSRIHSGKKGKAGSKRPNATKNPDWVTMQPNEVEALVIKLGKEGMSTAMIGLRLRDQYGIPNIRLATGKSVLQILASEGTKFDVPEDLSNLLKRSATIQSHMKANPKDLENKRGQTLIDSKIRRLTKYYKRVGAIPQDWTPAATIEAKAE